MKEISHGTTFHPLGGNTASYRFTLTRESIVAFYITDSPQLDNSGSVSLSVTPVLPGLRWHGVRITDSMTVGFAGFGAVLDPVGRS